MENARLDAFDGASLRGHSRLSRAHLFVLVVLVEQQQHERRRRRRLEEQQQTLLLTTTARLHDKQNKASVHARHTAQLCQQLSAHARETLLSFGDYHPRRGVEELHTIDVVIVLVVSKIRSDSDPDVVYFDRQVGRRAQQVGVVFASAHGQVVLDRHEAEHDRLATSGSATTTIVHVFAQLVVDQQLVVGFVDG